MLGDRVSHNGPENFVSRPLMLQGRNTYAGAVGWGDPLTHCHHVRSLAIAWRSRECQYIGPDGTGPPPWGSVFP